MFKQIDNSPVLTIEEIEDKYPGYTYLAIDKMDKDYKYKGIVVAIATQDDISLLIDEENKYADRGILTFTGVADNDTSHPFHVISYEVC